MCLCDYPERHLAALHDKRKAERGTLGCSGCFWWRKLQDLYGFELFSLDVKCSIMFGSVACKTAGLLPCAGGFLVLSHKDFLENEKATSGSLYQVRPIAFSSALSAVNAIDSRSPVCICKGELTSNLSKTCEILFRVKTMRCLHAFRNQRKYSKITCPCLHHSYVVPKCPQFNTCWQTLTNLWKKVVPAPYHAPQTSHRKLKADQIGTLEYSSLTDAVLLLEEA